MSDTLAHALRTKLQRLIASEPRLGERIDVHSLPALGERLYRALLGPPTIAAASLACGDAGSVRTGQLMANEGARSNHKCDEAGQRHER